MAYIGREPTKGEFKKVDVSSWTFNDSATTFPIGYQVGEVNQMVVSLNGVIQQPTTDFVLANGGTDLAFLTAPATGDSCFVVTLGDVGGVTIPDASIQADKLASNLKSFTEDHFTASGDSSSYTLTETPPSKHSILVTVDGIVQAGTNYTLVGSTLSFDSNLDSGSSLRIVHMGIRTVVFTLVDNSVTSDKLADSINVNTINVQTQLVAGKYSTTKTKTIVTEPIHVTAKNISADVTIDSNSNAAMIGPITVDSGVTITVLSGGTLTTI